MNDSACRLDRIILNHISAVRCDSSAPVPDFAPMIRNAIASAVDEAIRECAAFIYARGSDYDHAAAEALLQHYGLDK